MNPSDLASKSLHFQDDLIRNIKNIRQSQALFDDLTDDDQDLMVALAAEAQGQPDTIHPIVTRPFEYGSVITYSFDAAHWQATRFSDGRAYGVWYGSLDLNTTVLETVFHWHRFLMDSFANESRVIRGERRVFKVACDAILIDLPGATKKAAGLVNRKRYDECQALGRYLVEQGQNGVLVPSARGLGINAAIFNAERLSNVRDLCYLTYLCDPSRDDVKVERTPGRTWLRVRPSALY